MCRGCLAVKRETIGGCCESHDEEHILYILFFRVLAAIVSYSANTPISGRFR